MLNTAVVDSLGKDAKESLIIKSLLVLSNSNGLHLTYSFGFSERILCV